MYKLMKKMNIASVFGYYFLSNILITNSGLIINLNLKFTKQDPTSQLIFWVQKIPELTLKPALLMWLLYILFSNRSFLGKVIYLFMLLTALISIEIYFETIGYLEWVNWNVFYGYLRYSFITLLLVMYGFYFEKLINRDSEVKTE
jgi:hypothetical protein